MKTSIKLGGNYVGIITNVVACHDHNSTEDVVKVNGNFEGKASHKLSRMSYSNSLEELNNHSFHESFKIRQRREDRREGWDQTRLTLYPLHIRSLSRLIFLI